MLTGSAAIAGDARAPGRDFLGFRLLDLENQTVKWQSARLGEPARVTYALASAPLTTPRARNCAHLLPPSVAYEPAHIPEAVFRREVAAAFRMWEEAAGIEFREAADPQSADILIGAQGDPTGRAYTNVELKPAPAGTPGAGSGRKVIARSLICLNPHQPWKVGFDGNLKVYDLRYTIAHEIGHAIGLDHPGAAGALMSFRYDERHTGLQPGDMRGASLLYGPKLSGARLTRTEPAGATIPPGSSPIETGSLPSPRQSADTGAADRAFGIGPRREPQPAPPAR